MDNSPKMLEAFRCFDDANRNDPNMEVHEGQAFPKELLYAQRMTETLNAYRPNASEALQLSVRCQHIQRWEIPRDAYEKGRVGYLKWRQELKQFHADRATEILEEVGYDSETISQVKFLLLKKQLKKNEETQALEDVICLVFLKYYFEPFIKKHDEGKIIDILQKTWKKMSPNGHKAALQLQLSQDAMNLVEKAITA